MIDLNFNPITWIGLIAFSSLSVVAILILVLNDQKMRFKSKNNSISIERNKSRKNSKRNSRKHGDKIN